MEDSHDIVSRFCVPTLQNTIGIILSNLDNDSMMTLRELFVKTSKSAESERLQIVVKQLSKNSNGYRDVLREILALESKLIVLDCEKMILAEVLKQCQQVGLINDEYYFLLTSLDAHTVDLDDFKVRRML